METNKFTPFSVFMRLFHAQCILGVIGNCLPLDSKFDELRKFVFDAMMSVARCCEILDKVYDESKDSRL